MRKNKSRVVGGDRALYDGEEDDFTEKEEKTSKTVIFAKAPQNTYNIKDIMTTINGWGGTVAAPSDSYEEQLIREQKLLNDMAALVVVEEAAAAQKSVPVQRAMVPAVTRASEAVHCLPPASHRPAYASAPVRPAMNERASLYSYVIDYSLDTSFLAQRPGASVDEITRKKKMDLVSLLKGACASN